ncbi:MAG: MarR family transcriptional regulator [Capsulimonadales bacterium]|nr:MarR family transcriptional regulator [Capsulimonadales bacterium]
MPLLDTSETLPSTASEESSGADLLYHTLVRLTRMVLFPLDAPSPLDDLPISQVRCLSIVGAEEGRKMQEIAARLHIKLPAMSQMVDRLVRKGLMERRPDPTDRRVARLHLTPEARRMVAEARRIRMDHLRKITADMDPERVERITEDLREMVVVGAGLYDDLDTREGRPANTDPLSGVAENQDPLVEMLARRARNRRN